MKYLLILLIALSACTAKSSKEEPYTAFSCTGKVTEVSRFLVVITCNDGTMVTFSSPRTSMQREIIKP